MFKGNVVTEFVDRETRRHYRPGDTYTTKSEGRRDEIIAAGQARGIVYVEFEMPQEQKGKKAAKGSKQTDNGAKE